MRIGDEPAQCDNGQARCILSELFGIVSVDFVFLLHLCIQSALRGGTALLLPCAAGGSTRNP